MIPIGWSAGDLIAGIGVLVKVGKAFKEAGGAEEKYAAQTEFLAGLSTTLGVLKDVVESDHDPPQEIAAHIRRMEKPWKKFNDYLGKYEGKFDQTVDPSRTKKAIGTVSWSLKEMAGKVDALKEEVDAPMKSLHLCLTMEIWSTSRKLPSLIGDASDNTHVTMQQLAENICALITAQASAQQTTHERVSQELDAIRASLTDGLNDLRTGIAAETGDIKQEMSRSTAILLDSMGETATDPMAVLVDVQDALRKITDVKMTSGVEITKQAVLPEPRAHSSTGRGATAVADTENENREVFLGKLVDLGQATALVLAFVAGGLFTYQATKRPMIYSQAFDNRYFTSFHHFSSQPLPSTRPSTLSADERTPSIPIKSQAVTPHAESQDNVAAATKRNKPVPTDSSEGWIHEWNATEPPTKKRAGRPSYSEASARRESALHVRKERPCPECRAAKEPCDGGSPCATCMKLRRRCSKDPLDDDVKKLRSRYMCMGP